MKRNKIEQFIQSNGDFLIQSENELPIVGEALIPVTEGCHWKVFILRKCLTITYGDTKEKFISNYVKHRLKGL